MHSFVKTKTRPPGPWRSALLLAFGLVVLRPPLAAADEPSPGVLLRRARYAIAAGSLDEAAVALRAVRAAEPRSARGLEAALLLADVEVDLQDAAAADQVLDAAEHDFPAGDDGAQVLLARGWLALARADGTAALRHFGLVPARGPQKLKSDVALLGSAWGRLIAQPPPQDVPAELATLVAGASDPTLRVAAGLTLARAYAARGKHRKSLRKLRALRRLVRGTSFADDIELGIGLAQLDVGNAAAARSTFRRLARQQDRGVSEAPAPIVKGLTISDLRLAPAPFAARVARLYATRTDRASSLMTFFAGVFDRPASADVAAALSLADAALAARKDG